MQVVCVAIPHQLHYVYSIIAWLYTHGSRVPTHHFPLTEDEGNLIEGREREPDHGPDGRVHGVTRGEAREKRQRNRHQHDDQSSRPATPPDDRGESQVTIDGPVTSENGPLTSQGRWGRWGWMRCRARELWSSVCPTR